MRLPLPRRQGAACLLRSESPERRYGDGQAPQAQGRPAALAGPRIGANEVKVPTYLYKLVYDATTNRAWAHWQENREGETVGRPISYQELVKPTGVEFLPRSALQH